MIGTKFYKPLQPNYIQQEVDGEVVSVENTSGNCDKDYAQAAQWCNENNAAIEDKGEYYEVIALPEPTLEEQQQTLIKQYQNAIQDRLDSEARALGYDNADRVIMRQNSTNPRYKAEGEAFNVWYDQMWGYGNDMLNRVLAGEIEIPSLEDFLAGLPSLNIVYPEGE